MKKISKYLFLLVPLVMVAAMLFPNRVYAQSGTTPDVPTVPVTPGSTGSTVSDISSTTTGTAPSAVTCTSPGVYGDPWFKVGLVTYYFLLNGSSCPVGSTAGVNCFISAPGASTIQAALDWINGTSGLLPTDKKVYVEAGAYHEMVSIAGTPTNKVSNLIGLIGHGSADTIIYGPVSITGTKTGFTLSGFSITAPEGAPILQISSNVGALTLSDLVIKNTSSSGIVVNNHQGAITLNNVMSSNNASEGALLDNSSFATAYPVTITNSEFDDNTGGYGGLEIISKGAVTLNGVSASRNTGAGLKISNAASVTINNFTAIENKAGVYDQGNGVIMMLGIPGKTIPVTMNNVYLNGNTAMGAMVSTYGAVTLSNLEANGNGDYGFLITSPSMTAGAVKITNANFNSNGQSGLSAYSIAAVTLDTVNSSDNNGYGVYIDNCQWSSGKCLGLGGITISSKTGSAFNSNSYDGLYLTSAGTISMSDFSASGNAVRGALLLNSMSGSSAITIKTTLPGWINHFDLNDFGAQIISRGAISLTNTTASENTDYGINLDNSAAPLAQLVSIINGGFNNNGDVGLTVSSKGAISLTKVSAYGNTGGSGAVLDNTPGIAGVTIQPGTDGVYGNFNGNTGEGIHITSRGAITVKSVWADSNGYTGINLDNLSAASAGVTLAGGTASHNSGSGAFGLKISSHGIINISNFTAIDNKQSGAGVDNKTAAVPAAVTVTGSIFNGNGDMGLWLTSKGAVTLTSIRASFNGAWGSPMSNGVLVDNSWGSASVALTGTNNYFNNNGGEGLYVESKGNISLSGITASNNAYHAIWLINNLPGSTGNITITSPLGTYNNLTSNGHISATSGTSSVQINTFGNITIDRTNSNNNWNYGFWMDNTGGPLAKAITITDSSANGNQLDGFSINANGTVTLKGVTANNNSYYSRAISLGTNASDVLPFSGSSDSWYYTGTSGQNITIDLGSSEFDAFLYLYNSSGNLLVSDNNGGGGTNSRIVYTLPYDDTFRIVAGSYNNSGAGNYALKLYATGSDPSSNSTFEPAAKGISVNSNGNVTIQALNGVGISGSNNAAGGVYILTSGAVVGASVSGSNNGQSGVYIDNTSGVAKLVTLTGGIADANSTMGYEIYSKGIITASGLSGTNSTTGTGIYLDNTYAVTPLAISASNLLGNGNGATGLVLLSNGTVTLNHATANDNFYYGADLNSTNGTITLQGLAGVNNFVNNGWDGLRLNTTGSTVLDKILSQANGNSGIYVVNSASLSLTNSRLLYNQQNGLTAVVNGPVTINNVTAIDNGSLTYAGDGVYLYLGGALHPVAITNSVFISNHEAGIYLRNCTTYTLTNSFWFGNNTNNYPAVTNLICEP